MLLCSCAVVSLTHFKALDPDLIPSHPNPIQPNPTQQFSSGDDDDDKSDDDGGPDLSSPVGWVAVAGAIWVFGSYGILIKLPAVAATHPQVFQIYFSAGVALTSLLVQ